MLRRFSDALKARTLNLRNVAIIAHVDHGKTTLVDGMLRQTGLFREGQDVPDCVLDSNDLERERGITILAKNTVVEYRGTKINIIDTPGHADFGGEVERVLSMADGVLLLVDAAEGPMPQTRFVLSKAFQHGLRPIVVINKVDRPDARTREVVDEVLELFLDLDADEDALEFPVLYGSGRAGWMSADADTQTTDLTALFDTILEHVPAPTDDPNGPVQFRVSTLEWSDYVGRIVVGRVHRGTLRAAQRYALCTRDGTVEVQVRGLYSFDGLSRADVDSVAAGDLCGVWGIEEIDIGDSLTDLETVEPMPRITVDEPTVSIVLRVNDSPFAGKEGKYLTSRHLRERLLREERVSVALTIEQGPTPDSFEVAGRGVMHLGFLLETMRREGYEFAVARPRVIYREAEDGTRLEPIERLTVDAPEQAVGRVIEILGERRAELTSMNTKGSFHRLEFTVPARGLIGVRNRILNASGGEATMHHVYDGYGPFRGDIQRRTAGVMVAMSAGTATFYALDNLRDRGTFFVNPQTPVYEGMIVGEHCKEGDIVVNLSREKKLTNIRSSTKESFVKLLPPRLFGIEEALEYLGDDELVEITPTSVRLRKVLRNEKDRKRGMERVKTR